MGARHDYIQTLGGDKAAIKRYRAEQHQAGVAGLLPYTVNLSGGRKCIISDAFVNANGDWELTVEFSTGPTVHPFSNPWIISNPPLLWPDPVGDVEVRHDPADPATWKRYSENLLEVGRNIIERMHAKVSA